MLDRRLPESQPLRQPWVHFPVGSSLVWCPRQRSCVDGCEASRRDHQVRHRTGAHPKEQEPAAISYLGGRAYGVQSQQLCTRPGPLQQARSLNGLCLGVMCRAHSLDACRLRAPCVDARNALDDVVLLPATRSVGVNFSLARRTSILTYGIIVVMITLSLFILYAFYISLKDSPPLQRPYQLGPGMS